jgi:Protein of unknown function (DUF1425)
MKMPKTIAGAAVCGLVAGAMMAAGGCASSAPPVPAGDPFGAMSIHITAEAPLQQWLRIGDVKVLRDGLMTVVVPVRMAHDGAGDYSIQYRFTFLDQSGRPLASQTQWRMEQLTPRVEKILEGTALDAATDWRLEIRPARGGVR